MGDEPRGKTYGYVRVSTDKQAASPEAQRRAIELTAGRLGRGVDAYFQDAPLQNPDGTWNDARSGKVPLPERAAGRELCSKLARGDLVIAARVDRAFRRLSDCVLMLDRWEKAGVGLLLCDFPLLSDLSEPFGKALVQLVAVFAEVERKLISQRTREALAALKARGHAHTRHPGYGRRWERRWDAERGRHVRVRVGDEAERLVMGEIVERRQAGQSWDAIRRHLEYVAKARTRDGRPWSRSRIVRAYRAELELRDREQGGPHRRRGDDIE